MKNVLENLDVLPSDINLIGRGDRIDRMWTNKEYMSSEMTDRQSKRTV